MKKLIPFKKQLTFKTNVSEITSIALENTLHNNKQTVEGELIINGTYKITEASLQVDEFEFKIPMNIEIDNKYITEEMTIDINDFYYEIINNNILEVNIEISLDNIIEKTVIEELAPEQVEIIEKEEQTMRQNNEEVIENIKDIIKPQLKDDRCIEEETPNIEIKNIFDNFSDSPEDYSTYYIYIVREGDDLDSIMTRYSITREKLSEYNDLNELKIGNKIIIPEQNDARNK